jgi:hypothetical protein
MTACEPIQDGHGLAATVLLFDPKANGLQNFPRN